MFPNYGIGSFAYRYAAGFPGFTPGNPMTVEEFLRASADLGMNTVQICENLRYRDLPEETHAACALLAEELGLRVELGMNGLTRESLDRHLALCRQYRSSFLRIVIGGKCSPSEAGRILSEAIPRLEEENIWLGIENHFDLTSAEIAGLLDGLNSSRIGAVYDTTNSIGMIERPEETLRILEPWVISAHLKDYSIFKSEAGYTMKGEDLGSGSLPLPEILRVLLSSDKLQSLIMELSIKRDESLNMNAVIEKEKVTVRRNAELFKALLT